MSKYNTLSKVGRGTIKSIEKVCNDTKTNGLYHKAIKTAREANNNKARFPTYSAAAYLFKKELGQHVYGNPNWTQIAEFFMKEESDIESHYTHFEE